MVMKKIRVRVRVTMGLGLEFRVLRYKVRVGMSV